MKALRIHEKDTVAVALEPLEAGEEAAGVKATQPIPQGHKLALRKIGAGESVMKYGCPIGRASREIQAGEWVHTHNLQTGLDEAVSPVYQPAMKSLPSLAPRTFQGYRRADGRAGIRNELWIIPTVGCVGGIAQALARENQHLVSGAVEGLYAFPHPFGCSQLGADHAQTRRLLAALANHPNAAGVLVVSLGCENLTLKQFQAELGDWDDRRIKFLTCQEVSDEMAEGGRLLAQLAAYGESFKRQPLPASQLVVGLKCGGSDGLSGITANPCVGWFSDQLIAMGGTAILTEVPEMFGAETLLLSRCESQAVFNKALGMVEGFKEYFRAHGQAVYENPSPGNKAGGITTLEDKSCGCVQKGGTAPVTDVLPYGGQVSRPGLNLLWGPGNDLVSATALTAAGAHLILFTTGRGTPFGAPAPTLKIATHTGLYERKPGWMDFDAGPIAQGEGVAEAGARLLEAALTIASGQPTRSEANGFREIALFKDGITL